MNLKEERQWDSRFIQMIRTISQQEGAACDDNSKVYSNFLNLCEGSKVHKILNVYFSNILQVFTINFLTEGIERTFSLSYQ
jgi:hypothetical protein